MLYPRSASYSQPHLSLPERRQRTGATAAGHAACQTCSQGNQCTNDLFIRLLQVTHLFTRIHRVHDQRPISSPLTAPVAPAAALVPAARDLITRTIALVPRLERQIDAIRQTLMAKQKFISEMLDNVMGKRIS